MPHYFAYGSNLHPLRLIERVPSAALIGVAKLCGYSLCFQKKGNDGSSKCTMIKTASASDYVYGAVYTLKSEHRPDLDHYEGKGYGYRDHHIELNLNASSYSCFTYLAQPEYMMENLKPFHWYKQLVMLGAQYLDFPADYRSSIEVVSAIPDPDRDRNRAMQSLIERIQGGRQ